MDWDGNQKEIRDMLVRVEDTVKAMVYEADPEAREEMSAHAVRNIGAVLAKTENMTRWLKGFEQEGNDAGSRGTD